MTTWLPGHVFGCSGQYGGCREKEAASPSRRGVLMVEILGTLFCSQKWKVTSHGRGRVEMGQRQLPVGYFRNACDPERPMGVMT